MGSAALLREFLLDLVDFLIQLGVSNLFDQLPLDNCVLGLLSFKDIDVSLDSFNFSLKLFPPLDLILQLLLDSPCLLSWCRCIDRPDICRLDYSGVRLLYKRKKKNLYCFLNYIIIVIIDYCYVKIFYLVEKTLGKLQIL